MGQFFDASNHATGVEFTIGSPNAESDVSFGTSFIYAAEFRIHLQGAPTLTLPDFIL